MAKGNLFSDASVRRISNAVKRVEAMPHGFVPPSKPGTLIPYVLDLYELATAPELDDDLRMYKATGYPCYLRWCTVDGDGHYAADASEGDPGAIERWRKDDSDDAVTLWFPASTIDDNQEASVVPSAAVGDRVYTSVKEARRIVLSTNLGLIPIMLKTSLAPGGTADAYPTEPDGTIIDEDVYWTVTDTVGDKRARGKDDVAEGEDGAKGIAQRLSDGTLAIVEIQRQAKRCKCQLTGALTDTTASCTVDNVAPTDGGMNPVNSTGDGVNLTAYIQLNPSSSGGFAGADNTVCYIEWHEDDDKWYIYEMPCEA